MLVVFGVTAGAMWLIFRFAGWYADTSALPRYCSDPAGAIGLVDDILSNPDPIGEARRRPYLVAAKLIFLVPRQNDETKQDYLQRLRVTISQSCGARF